MAYDKTLAQRISHAVDTGRPLPSLDETGEMLDQIADALDYAHERGVKAIWNVGDFVGYGAFPDGFDEGIGINRMSRQHDGGDTVGYRLFQKFKAVDSHNIQDGQIIRSRFDFSECIFII